MDIPTKKQLMLNNGPTTDLPWKYVFRDIEIKSIASLLKVNLKWGEVPLQNPFWTVELESDEDVRRIASRSVTLRYALDLWSSANTSQELHEHLKSLPDSFFTPYSDLSFKIKVEVFGSSQSQEEKIERIERFGHLPLSGPVRLSQPQLALQYIEFYGATHQVPSAQPSRLHFGRIVCEGRRELITKHSLKSRKFIGNTSMDPTLALLMANQAQLSRGHLVYDPFVGSGSTLIAAAEFGGYVLGMDIDFLMIHGKSRPTRKQDRGRPRQDESILGNLRQYGLERHYVDILAGDSSRPLWRGTGLFDAIITDPPYGMREAVERIGSSRGSKEVPKEHLAQHVPSKVQYSLVHLTSDLLGLAGRQLRLGGYLVFWLPVIRCEYDESKLPTHPNLELIGNSEQILSTTSSRRLLTYRKVQDLNQTSTNGSFESPMVEESEESFRQRYFKYVEILRKNRTDKFYEDLSRKSLGGGS